MENSDEEGPLVKVSSSNNRMVLDETDSEGNDAFFEKYLDESSESDEGNGTQSDLYENQEAEMDEDDYEEEEEEEEEEEDDDEVYGRSSNSRSKLKHRSKGFKRSRKASDSEEEDYRPKRASRKKNVSGIISDEDLSSSDDDSDDGIGRKKVPFTGEIPFNGSSLLGADETSEAIESIGDWNEGSKEILVKYKGRSWRMARWIPLKSPELSELPAVRRKVANFLQKVQMEREENEEGISIWLENMRYNIEMNWRELERIIAVHQTKDRGAFYLCKWRGLGYASSTWEWEGEVRGCPNGQATIDEFLNRHQYGHHRSAFSHKSINFRRYLAQPSFISKDLDLRDYQLDGINWLLYSWSKGDNVILADEMGLGKTIQSVCFLTALKVDYQFSGPSLVVVPLSTIDAWQREFARWAGDYLNVVVYIGDAASRQVARFYEFAGPCDVLLTTYELVLKDHEVLRQAAKWRALLVDEGHRLKNASSQLYDVLFSLVPRAGRVLITGTPLQNSLGELWCLLRFLMPDKFSDYESFLSKYSLTFDGYEDNSALRELHALIKPHILRRLKRDVEKSLPGKFEQIVRVDLTPRQKQLYRFILTRNFRELKRTQEAAGVRNLGGLLNILGELKKVCNHPLLLGTGSLGANALMEQEEDGGEEIFRVEDSGKLMLLRRLLRRLYDEGHRVLIFSQSVKMLNLLQQFIKAEGYHFQRLDGSKSSAERHLAITSFNDSASRDFVFLLSTRAGGLGINLATADTVIIYDSDWNPQNDLQAMARAHRIGQKRTVRIFRLVSALTVEEEILERAKRKMVLDHLVIQQLKKDRPKPASDITEGISNSSDLQAILKFGARALFDSDTPAFSADAIDLDTLFREAESAAEPNDPEAGSPKGGESEFLDQFRIADLGSKRVASGESTNWDEIIPEAERHRMEEEERAAAQLAQEMELQEALLTSAQSRRRSGNQEKAKEGTSSSRASESNIAVLFAKDDSKISKCFDDLCRFGKVSGKEPCKELEGEIVERLSSCGKEVRCRLCPTGPIIKQPASLSQRIEGLRRLQASLTTFSLSNAKGPMPSDSFEGYRIPLARIRPANFKGVSYTIKEDSLLLVQTAFYGYGSWEAIRTALLPSEPWIRLQTAQLARRIDYLLKEFSGFEEKPARKPLIPKKAKIDAAETVKAGRFKEKSVAHSKAKASPITSVSLKHSRVEQLIEKFRRPFKSVRGTLIELDALKGRDRSVCEVEGNDRSLASELTQHLRTLGDFIDSQDQLRNDPDAWEFISSFWPFEKGSTGRELRKLYTSLSK